MLNEPKRGRLQIADNSGKNSNHQLSQSLVAKSKQSSVFFVRTHTILTFSLEFQTILYFWYIYDQLSKASTPGMVSILDTVFLRAFLSLILRYLP
ncbi:hypothetical protein ACFE6N_20980 [Pedobacter sp. BG31]|uniref:hypothetical protein n=1 Tax=Pedobacter sp. BG31 TaxID=3349697 RepID=UPI0035F294BE